jgi:hypothetical protein
MITINQPIVSCSVVDPSKAKVEVKSTLIERTEALSGCTYKIKTPLSEHALYVTINNIEINGKLRPFELFINSKSMDHFQWIVAFTRIVSAIFRHGGEVNFLIEELRSVFDPRGGFFYKTKYVPSIVSLIGDVIEQHLSGLGLYVKDNSLQEAAVAMIEEKKVANGDGTKKAICQKCNEAAVVVASGCATCLACGDSRCS